MASRFFAGGASDTSSDESDDEQQQQQQQQQQQLPKEQSLRKAAPKTFTYAGSDESDDEKRVVRSKREKYLEELGADAKHLDHALGNGDWSKAEDAFRSLTSKLDKFKKEFSSPPAIIVQAALTLDDAIKAAWGSRKSLNKVASSSLSRLRSSLPKDVRKITIGSLVLADVIEQFKDKRDEVTKLVAEELATTTATTGHRADEDEEDEDESDDESDEEDTTARKAKSKKPAASVKKAITGDDDEDSDDFWGQDEEDEEEDEDDIEPGFKYTAEYFLKKAPEEEDEQKKKKKAEKAAKAKAKEEEKKQAELGEDQEEGDDGFQLIGKRSRPKKERVLFEKNEEITIDGLLQKYENLLDERGKHSTSHAEQRKLFKELRDAALANQLGSGIVVLMQQQVVAAHFDEPASVAGYMRPAAWANCHDDLMYMLTVLVDNPNISVLPRYKENDENVKDTAQPYRVAGDVASHIERLDEEFTKCLRATDPYTPDYVHRLRDEPVLYNLICLGEQYAEKLGDPLTLARIRLRRIEHIYYKREYVPVGKRRPVMELPSERDNEDHVAPLPENKDIEIRWVISDEEERDTLKLMDRLCKYIYSLSIEEIDRIRIRAMLCHIYHYALCDKWDMARDLMLMSHIQEHISHSDIPTQVLYNRAMVQLGLAAFRAGKVLDAQNALSEIWQNNRARELLAQGVQYNQRAPEKTEEEKLIERRRQMPFHMHINLELVESVFYTCSILQEIPLVAQAQHDPTRIRPYVNKPVRRQLEMYCKQAYNAAPENTRESIMAASLALLQGNWRQCQELIFAIKAWRLLPNVEAVKEMLSVKIREAALKTHLFANSGFYDAMSIEGLANKFELKPERVHCIAAKMIHNRELFGSLDQPTQTIFMRKEEPSSLQLMALNFAEKISQLVDNSEKLLDMRQQTQQGGSQGGGGRGRPRQFQNRGMRQFQARRQQHGGSSGGGSSSGGHTPWANVAAAPTPVA